MAVNLIPPQPEQLLPIAGVTLGFAKAGIKKPNRKDLLVFQLAESAKVAGSFTKNRFCAAPVIVAKEHLHPGNSIRALVINTGNANAGTGEQGLIDARHICSEVAQLLHCQPQQVLPFSTGVIMEPLPVAKIKAGLPACINELKTNHWYQAAEAIMTTDTLPKAASRQLELDGATISVTGISKGAGMIRPNMATMLGFIATDAKLSQPLVADLLQHAVNRSFNCITVDGDTSTNDACILIATGQTGPEINDAASEAYRKLRQTITELAVELAQAIVRDGEGATKFITIQIEGGKTEAECKQIGYAIGHSPLIKTAFYASDPNLGRILAAIGYAGIDDLDVNKIDVFLDDVWVATAGGRHPEYREEAGQRVMQQAEITIRVVLNRGNSAATIWSCDLSHDYVSINADYRS